MNEPPVVKRDRVLVVTKVPAAGVLQRLTRGKRFIHVEYSSRPHTKRFPTVAFSSRPDGAPDPEFSDRLARFYGASATTSQRTSRCGRGRLSRLPQR